MSASLERFGGSLEVGSSRKGRLLPAGCWLSFALAFGSVGTACQDEQNAAIARTHRARTLLNQGDPEAAVEAARQALKEDGKNPEALAALGMALELKADYNGAADAFSRLAAVQPDNSVVRSHLGRALALSGRNEEARAALVEARSMDPMNLDAVLLSAAISEDTETLRQAKQAIDSMTGDMSKGLSAEQVLVQEELARSLGEPIQATPAADRAAQLPVSSPATASALTELYRRRGKLPVVEQLLKRLTVDAPNPEPLAVQLVTVALQLDHLDVAKQALTKVNADLDAAPASVLAHARVAAATGRPRAAHKRFAMVIPRLSGRQQDAARFQHAQVLLAMGERARVEAELRALLKAEFGYMTAASMLCDLLEATGRSEQVAAVLEPLVARHPDDPRLLSRLGQTQLSHGQGEAAKATFEKLAALVPEDPRGPHLVGTALQALGQTEQAEAKYREALVLMPGMEPAVKGLVAMALEKKRPQDAVAVLEEQLAAQPSNAFLYRTLGKLQADQGNPEQAEAAFRRATELAPEQAVNWFQWGEHLQARGVHVRAQEMFRKGLIQEPRNTAGWMRLGGLLYSSGDDAGALEAFEKALDLDPSFLAAQNNVAMLLAKQKRDLPRALALAKAAHEAAPDLASVSDTLGWLYHLSGKTDEALPLLAEAAKAVPSASTFYHLGVAQAAKGDTANARKALNQALKLEPQFPEADAARAQLAALN